jgi:hypothetical protein
MAVANRPIGAQATSDRPTMSIDPQTQYGFGIDTVSFDLDPVVPGPIAGAVFPA